MRANKGGSADLLSRVTGGTKGRGVQRCLQVASLLSGCTQKQKRRIECMNCNSDKPLSTMQFWCIVDSEPSRPFDVMVDGNTTVPKFKESIYDKKKTRVLCDVDPSDVDLWMVSPFFRPVLNVLDDVFSSQLKTPVPLVPEDTLVQRIEELDPHVSNIATKMGLTRNVSHYFPQSYFFQQPPFANHIHIIVTKPAGE